MNEFETEICEEPPDPLLQKITDIAIQNGGQWSGSATELTTLLDSNIAPNKLTLKFNINASKLRYDYGIDYQNIHTHDGRCIELKLIKDDSVTVGDDCDDKTDCCNLS